MEYTLTNLRTNPQEIVLSEVLIKQIYVQFERWPGGRLALNGDIYRPISINRIYTLGQESFRQQPTVPVASINSLVPGENCNGFSVSALDDYTQVKITVLTDEPQVGAGFLDSFPDGVAFGVERAYTGSYTPIVSDGPIVARVNSNNLQFTFNAVDLVYQSGDYIYGTDDSYLVSGDSGASLNTSITCLVIRPREIFDGRFLEGTTGGFTISIGSDGRLGTTRSKVGGGNVFIFRDFSANFIGKYSLVTVVSTPTSLALYQDGNLLQLKNDASGTNSYFGPIRANLKKVDFKFGAIWQTPPLPDVSALNAFLMQHYNIAT
ncbi:MAG: hypothetical protein AAFW84_09740 [Cyanobacteria bacterium J06635_15]